MKYTKFIFALFKFNIIRETFIIAMYNINYTCSF
jgi:hypothetical protein